MSPTLFVTERNGVRGDTWSKAPPLVRLAPRRSDTSPSAGVHCWAFSRGSREGRLWAAPTCIGAFGSPIQQPAASCQSVSQPGPTSRQLEALIPGEGQSPEAWETST